MELQWRHVAVILDVLPAVERVGDQLLQHFRCELAVLDAEAEVLA